MRLMIPPVIQILATGMASWGAAALLPALSYELAGVPVVARIFFIAGIACVLPSLWAFFQAKTTVNPVEPDQATSLVTTGMYSISRNPMYLGFLLILTGWALELQNAAALLPVPLFVWIMTILQIRPEEEALEELFGEDYNSYRKRVRRWI